MASLANVRRGWTAPRRVPVEGRGGAGGVDSGDREASGRPSVVRPGRTASRRRQRRRRRTGTSRWTPQSFFSIWPRPLAPAPCGSVDSGAGDCRPGDVGLPNLPSDGRPTRQGRRSAGRRGWGGGP